MTKPEEQTKKQQNKQVFWKVNNNKTKDMQNKQNYNDMHLLNLTYKGRRKIEPIRLDHYLYK